MILVVLRKRKKKENTSENESKWKYKIETDKKQIKIVKENKIPKEMIIAYNKNRCTRYGNYQEPYQHKWPQHMNTKTIHKKMKTKMDLVCRVEVHHVSNWANQIKNNINLSKQKYSIPFNHNLYTSKIDCNQPTSIKRIYSFSFNIYSFHFNRIHQQEFSCQWSIPLSDNSGLKYLCLHKVKI